MRYLLLTFFTCCLALSTGCTNTSTLAGNVYTSNQAKTGMKVQYGTITNIRTVTIQANDSGIGGIAGAAIGGIGGSGVTDSRTESQLIGVVGGVIGSIVGKKVEDAVNRVESLEMDVQLESGETYVVVQKAEQTAFAKGQRVRVIGSGSHMHLAPIQ